MSQVKQTFAPEFINRLDEIIIFDELTDADLSQIIDLQVAKLNGMLEKRNLKVRMTGRGRALADREDLCGSQLWSEAAETCFAEIC